MDMDKAALRSIADRADQLRDSARKAEQRQEHERAAARKRAAEEAADKILASIPEELKKAAPNAQKISGSNRRIVTAKIAVVRERMTSIMSSRGFLEGNDKHILKAVQEKLGDLHIEGVELALKYTDEPDSFGSADGIDSASGMSKHYFIEAKIEID